MKSNNMTSFIIISSTIVLSVFISVLCLNLIPNYESNSYFIKVDEDMSAKIESVNIENEKLIVTTSGDPKYCCVKSTRSRPADNSLCWNEIENNTVSISIFEHKKYYVWIKDSEGHISNYITVNSANEKKAKDN